LHTREVFNEEGMEIDRGKIVDVPGEDYKRYLRTEDGVSPRTLPGTKGGIHRATSDEHNEYGEIFEGAENRKLMVEKRMKKIAVALADCPGPELIGEEGADITFVTWGSNKAALKEVIAESGVSANILVLRTAFPFHVSEVSTILKTSKRSILVEQNYTGQLGGLIAEQTGVQIEEKILRYDGRPITAEFILKNINQK